MKRTFFDLCRAARRNEVFKVDGFAAGQHIGLGRWSGPTLISRMESRKRLQFDQPNFDLGNLLDRQDPTWIGEDVYNHYLFAGHDSIMRSEYFQPYPRCAYLFHCGEDAYDYSRTYCSLLEQTEVGIVGTTLVRQHAPHGHHWARWVQDPAVFSIELDGSVIFRFNVPRPNASDEVISALTARVSRTLDDAIVATMLINAPPHLVQRTQARSAGLKIRNRNRRAGAPRHEVPTLISLDRVRLVEDITSGARQAADGPSKAPHLRRAHIRVLWRGTPEERTVDVRATTVNGGKAAQTYKVVARAQ
jgi:hypothetical protein